MLIVLKRIHTGLAVRHKGKACTTQALVVGTARSPAYITWRAAFCSKVCKRGCGAIIRRGRSAQAPVVPPGGHLQYWDSGSASASAANSGMEISNHWGAVDRDTQVRGLSSPRCVPAPWCTLYLHARPCTQECSGSWSAEAIPTAWSRWAGAP